jgi:hypothetical protein
MPRAGPVNERFAGVVCRWCQNIQANKKDPDAGIWGQIRLRREWHDRFLLLH